MPDSPLPHPQGSVSWLDTMAAAPDELLAFYQPLLGWSGEAAPDDPNRYAIQEVSGGKAVAAVGALPPGAPESPWTGYFAVDDADATAARMADLGGAVVTEPADVGPLGRFALGADPGGAPFGLWQAGQFPGFQVFGEPGSLFWLELLTTEGKASAAFYGALLGAEVQELAELPGTYWTLHVDGQPRAGIFRVDATPANQWRPYFQVADVDASVAAAVAAGARATDPPMDSPFGRMAGLIDPSGREFRLATPPA